MILFDKNLYLSLIPQEKNYIYIKKYIIKKFSEIKYDEKISLNQKY